MQIDIITLLNLIYLKNVKIIHFYILYFSMKKYLFGVFQYLIMC